MRHAVCPDGYLRGILQFYGANRTGRWAGRTCRYTTCLRTKIPDLDLARDLVKQEDFDTLELLFEGIPFVFSELIRTAFIRQKDTGSWSATFSAILRR